MGLFLRFGLVGLVGLVGRVGLVGLVGRVGLVGLQQLVEQRPIVHERLPLLLYRQTRAAIEGSARIDPPERPLSLHVLTRLLSGRPLLAPNADLLAYHRSGITSGTLALFLLGSTVATEVEWNDAFEREYIMTSARLAPAMFGVAGGGKLHFARLLFGRDAGLLLIYALLEVIDGERPVGEGSVSVSGMAMRLGVSRPHILKMLVDATDHGLLLWNRRRRTVRLAPGLLEDMEIFFSGMLAVHELYLERASEGLGALHEG